MSVVYPTTRNYQKQQQHPIGGEMERFVWGTREMSAVEGVSDSVHLVTGRHCV